MKKADPREPAILRTNLKFVRPAFTPARRRFNEAIQLKAVDKYLRWLGFGTLVGSNTITASMNYKGKNYHVVFKYIESELDIQKTFSVHIEGTRSNITSLRKLYPNERV